MRTHPLVMSARKAITGNHTGAIDREGRHSRPSGAVRKAIVITAAFLFLVPGIATAQNVAVAGASGTAGPYATLKAAFDAINATAQTGNTITITLQGNTTETATAMLNAGTWTSLTIQPSGGLARTITGGLAAPIIDLNGADHVTIDGLNSGGNTLTITNTQAVVTNGTSTIRFWNDASDNTIRRCTIRGASTGFNVTNTTQTGTILFSTGTTTGNDDNLIEDCDILNIGALDATASLPTRAIYSFGSTNNLAAHNSGNIVRNCRIANFWLAGASRGIQLAEGNHAWTIEGNRFFQGAMRSHAGTAINHRVIHVVPGVNTSSLAGAHEVKDNIIGHATAAGTGTYSLTSTTGSPNFRGILFEYAGPCIASNVTGNSIRNISINPTSSGAPNTRGISFEGMDTAPADSIRITDNTIRDISITSGSGATPTSWIRVDASNTSVTARIFGNSVRNAINSGGAATTVNGIDVVNASVLVLRDTIDVLSCTTTSLSAACVVQGVSVANGTLLEARRNVFQTLSATARGASTVRGIYHTGSSASDIRNNSLTTLTANTTSSSGQCNVQGIHVTNGELTAIGNTISGLRSPSNEGPGQVRGIVVSNGVGSHTVKDNAINTLFVRSSNLGAVCTMHGINVSGGDVTASGNAISGFDLVANGPSTAVGLLLANGNLSELNGNSISNLRSEATNLSGANITYGISLTGGQLTAGENTIGTLLATGNGSSTCRGIFVSGGSGNHAVASNSVVGFTALPTNLGGVSIAEGIHVNGGALAASGNTISGGTASGRGASTARGIYSLNGALTALNNAVATLSSTSELNAAQTWGIMSSGTGPVTVSNNTIQGLSALDKLSTGNITISGSGTFEHRACGVDVSGAAAATVEQNTITNLLASNPSSVLNPNLQSDFTYRANAIGILASGTSLQANNNTISGLSSVSIPDALPPLGSKGIRTTSSSVSATGNLIHGLTSTVAGGVNENASVIGIDIASGSGAVLLNKNIVHSLTNTGNTDVQRAVTGIRTANTGSVLVERNLVHSLVPSAGSGAVALTSIATGIQYAAGAAGGTLRNNMVRMGIAPNGSSISNGCAIAGIHVAGGNTSMNLYHNSVYTGGTATSGSSDTHALLSTVSIARDHRNNIFWNARGGNGTHYAMQVANAGTGLTSDYNCLRATGTNGVLGRAGAADHADLAAWRAVTEKDGSSIIGDPQFVNATGDANSVDLHVFLPTPVDGAGTLIPNPNQVVDDFDYDARPAPALTNPDIGADELALTLLPVELVNLNATPGRSDVLLTWTTLSERASHRFLVERSADGRQFRPIGEVRAAGWSQRPIDYRYTDKDPLIGVNYYRLRQEDLDGSHEHSNTVAARFTRTATDLNPWPNPADDRILLALPEGVEGPVAVEVYDAGGRLVRALRPEASSGGQLEVPLEGLDAGAYLLRLSTRDGVPLGMGRFVKK